MLSLTGPIYDHFAILASRSTSETYRVAIFPVVAALDQEVEVSAAKFRIFLAKQRGQIDPYLRSETADIFIHSLTKDDIFELTTRATQ